MTVTDDFQTLFEGNREAVGTEQGGCLRRENGGFWWERQIHAHLQGTPPCGVYPMVPAPRWQPNGTDPLPVRQVDSLTSGGRHNLQWRVHWGCIDFDEGEDESFAHARNVWTVLQEFGITAWVERSRSKGYHVWVFLREWLPTRLVREALLAACQVVDAPTKEINPKSIAFDDPTTLGNYVRLPYPGGLVKPCPFPKDRRVMVDVAPDGILGAALGLEWFVDHAMASRASRAQLEPLQAMYEPPKRFVPPAPALGLEGDIYKRMSGLAWTIFKDGPKGDMGRGHTLFKLACVLAEAGTHTFDEVVQLCLEADEAWGKFLQRANGEAQVLNLVERAFGA